MALSGSINFLSASEVGTYLATGSQLNIGDGIYGADLGNQDPGRNDFIPNDFVGLNTNISEPVSASKNTLGYPLGSSFRLDPTNEHAQKWYLYKGGYPSASSDTTYAGFTRVLNGLLHHRNGPYQHPSWKQLRGGDHDG